MAKRNYKMIECKVVLTAEEIEAAAETLAAKTMELDDLELQKKAINAAFKERAERISGEIRTAGRLYRDKFDMRPVECWVVKDYEYGEIRYVRTDTFETVKRETRSHAERQVHIDEAIKNDEGAGESVELTSGKQSGSDGGAEKSAEELRQEKETRQMMSSEASSLN